MNENTLSLEQFRMQVNQSFNGRADARMDLLDALCGQTRARSVAELSLEAGFRRTYRSVYAAIDVWCTPQAPQTGPEAQVARLQRLIAGFIPPPEREPFWVFASDATSVRRQFAETLADRSDVYAPNAVAGNKPVTVGHQYGVLACRPARGIVGDVLPDAVQRVLAANDVFGVVGLPERSA